MAFSHFMGQTKSIFELSAKNSPFSFSSLFYTIKYNNILVVVGWENKLGRGMYEIFYV